MTGFCWGGGTTNWLATALGADLHAGVPYYGAAAETAGVAKIKAPLLAQLAENDERINSMYPTYQDERRRRACATRCTRIPARSTASTTTPPRATREAAAKQSWDRTVAFFKKNLA